MIAINGGITNNAQIAEQLQSVDGVMVGREAYHNPWLMSDWDATFYDEPLCEQTRESVEQQMVDYMAREAALRGTPWSTIARHMLGLRHGLPGARRWRQVWSDHRLKGLHPAEVAAIAQGEATKSL
jgi:tRNA-dihydrouridine synthase A